jgi:hypothetical protein
VEPSSVKYICDDGLVFVIGGLLSLAVKNVLTYSMVQSPS